MMGGAIEKSCLKQILASQHQAGGLRSAETFAAAIGNGIGTLLKIPVGHIGPFCCRVNKCWNPVCAPNFCHLLRRYLTSFFGVTENKEHRGLIVDGGFELGFRVNLNHLDTDHTDCVVVDIPMTGLDDNLVFHSGGVGKADHLLGIASSHTSCCHLTQCCSTTIGDQSPLTLHQLSNSCAYTFHQFVEIDIAL